MPKRAKLFIVTGALLLAVGLVLLLLPKSPFPGKVPGDIIKREDFTFYFPLSTSIVVSLVLWTINRFRQ